MKYFLGILTIIAGFIAASQLWRDGHKVSAGWVMITSLNLAIRQSV